MKNIKYFKHKDSFVFEKLLKGYGYTIDDVKGFSISLVSRYRGNILRAYIIYFKDNEYVCFKAVYFSSFNECNQSRLGANGNKLLM